MALTLLRKVAWTGVCFAGGYAYRDAQSQDDARDLQRRTSTVLASLPDRGRHLYDTAHKTLSSVTAMAPLSDAAAGGERKR